jgi:plasmid stabilization system protein ParE
MSRYILAPQAAQDLIDIWRYIREQSSVTIADRVERTIRDRMGFLSSHPRAGHWRRDMTSQNVKFFSVYS